MNSFFLPLYRLLVPLFIFLLHILSLLNEKIKLGIQLRKNSPWLKQKFDDPIWFHCSSGEFEYAKPVIKAIKQEKPNQKIIVTYFSPSSKKNIESFALVDFATPTPLESPKQWREFVIHHNPRALLIARTDLWPEMLAQCEEHKVPTLLFSATLTEDSQRMKPWGKPFYSWLTKKITTVFCVSQADQACFAELGHQNTEIHPDTRFDQVFERLKKPKPINEELFLFHPRENTFIAGSTWPEDEEILLPALKQLLEKKPSAKIIIAPHEPSAKHLEQLEAQLKEVSISYQRYTQNNDQWNNQVLIIDQVGILAELYPLAIGAFVGGSFKKTVHSVMEPLAAGNFIFLGPLFKNNREAIHFQNVAFSAQKAISIAHNPSQLAAGLIQLFQYTERLHTSENLKEEVQQYCGGTKAVTDWLNSV